jgi:hypothetical protein
MCKDVAIGPGYTEQPNFIWKNSDTVAADGRPEIIRQRVSVIMNCCVLGLN